MSRPTADPTPDVLAVAGVLSASLTDSVRWKGTVATRDHELTILQTSQRGWLVVDDRGYEYRATNPKRAVIRALQARARS